MRAAWETILDSRLQPESKGKNFLSIETFTSMIPKVAEGMKWLPA